MHLTFAVIGVIFIVLLLSLPVKKRVMRRVLRDRFMDGYYCGAQAADLDEMMAYPIGLLRSRRSHNAAAFVAGYWVAAHLNVAPHDAANWFQRLWRQNRLIRLAESMEADYRHFSGEQSDDSTSPEGALQARILERAREFLTPLTSVSA